MVIHIYYAFIMIKLCVSIDTYLYILFNHNTTHTHMNSKGDKLYLVCFYIVNLSLYLILPFENVINI